jgi:hypothetical membrane protein
MLYLFYFISSIFYVLRFIIISTTSVKMCYVHNHEMAAILVSFEKIHEGKNPGAAGLLHTYRSTD